MSEIGQIFPGNAGLGVQSGIFHYAEFASSWLAAPMTQDHLDRDLDKRPKLREELGPSYRPLMGLPMGHYRLDMAQVTHRLAARKVTTTGRSAPEALLGNTDNVHGTYIGKRWTKSSG